MKPEIMEAIVKAVLIMNKLGATWQEICCILYPAVNQMMRDADKAVAPVVTIDDDDNGSVN